MFDWLKKLLIDEEIEEIEEDKLEKIDFTKVSTIDNIVSDTPKEEKEVETKEEVKEEVKEVVEEVVVKKNEFNIQLTEPVKKEEKPKVEPRPKREKVQSEQKEVYIGSVISPIFGGSETKKSEKTVRPVLQAKKRDSLGTVISPMYGQAELLSHEKAAMDKINETKKEPVILNDEWKNDIPLEELISNDVETNDCVQFSLFGDEHSINE